MHSPCRDIHDLRSLTRPLLITLSDQLLCQDPTRCYGSYIGSRRSAVSSHNRAASRCSGLSNRHGRRSSLKPVSKRGGFRYGELTDMLRSTPDIVGPTGAAPNTGHSMRPRNGGSTATLWLSSDDSGASNNGPVPSARQSSAWPAPGRGYIPTEPGMSRGTKIATIKYPGR